MNLWRDFSDRQWPPKLEELQQEAGAEPGRPTLVPPDPSRRLQASSSQQLFWQPTTLPAGLPLWPRSLDHQWRKDRGNAARPTTAADGVKAVGHRTHGPWPQTWPVRPQRPGRSSGRTRRRRRRAGAAARAGVRVGPVDCRTWSGESCSTRRRPATPQVRDQQPVHERLDDRPEGSIKRTRAR